MLKFVKQHVTTIQGIEIYPLISLCIFVLFFALLFWWVITISKATLNESKHIPFDNPSNLNHDE